MAPETDPTTKRAELPMRLTRLRVKNFRSIADIDIPLSPLTVLVGPNGSGKSNVVDALRFVRDVFARGLDQAVMDREGMGVIQRAGTEGEGITIGVTVDIEETSEKSQFNDYDERTDEVLKTPASTLSYDFQVIETNKQAAVAYFEVLTLIIHKPNYPDAYFIRTTSSQGSALISGYKKWQRQIKELQPQDKDYDRDDLWMPYELFAQGRAKFIHHELNSSVTDNDKSIWLGFGTDAALKFEELIERQLSYTLNPADLRQPQQLLKETPFDEKGRNLAAVLRRLSRNGGANWDGLLFALRQAVTGFENIEVETVGGYLATKLIYKIDDTEPRTSYLGQESDGTIRMLGLLAALQQEPAQPFISIEEPEANIHPGALAVLAGVLDEASLRSQILVTTHSPDMLDHLPAESFLIVEKVGDTTRVGPLDASQLASVRKRLFTPGELLRMEGLQRQPEADSAT